MSPDPKKAPFFLTQCAVTSTVLTFPGLMQEVTRVTPLPRFWTESHCTGVDAEA